ncbi:hypothetical protein [Xenorhabdus bovienii]|uniref:hypothetical protein n=1 Tax=Xenorhabdus bovienii TaxID=40576 RepID=UPI00301C409B
MQRTGRTSGRKHQALNNYGCAECHRKRYKYAPLRTWCRENDIEVVKVPDTRYGHVKSWPAEAWLAVYGVEPKKLFGVKSGD